MLKLDHHDEVEGQSMGNLRSLDIEQSTFIGGVPATVNPRVFENLGKVGLGTMVGFYGRYCTFS